MGETQDEPVFVVKLAGTISSEDIERYEREFSEQLPGRVVMVDNGVADVCKVIDSMQSRDATVTIHHQRREFESMGADGNTPNYRYHDEIEQVSAKVWPVSMGHDELLVEYEDGTLGVAKLWDIRMEVIDE